MRYQKTIQKAFALLILVSLVSPAIVSAAYTVDKIGLDPARTDFVIGPGKTELTLKPGESGTVEVLVSNRTGIDRNFELSVEDFTGSRNENETVKLLGTDKGPYSLKDFISFPEKKFYLKNGTRARVPVTITIPKDATPGGRYGSVVTSTVSDVQKPKEAGGAQGGVPLITRAATLFFVTIPGNIKMDANFKDFRTFESRWFYNAGPMIPVQMVLENNSSVHISPSAKIEVKNMMGSLVREITVEPWFTMPDSLRMRQVEIQYPFFIGKYTVTATVDLGFGGKTDTKSVSFWVIPWAMIFYIFLGVVAVLWIYRAGKKWFAKTFELKRKDPPSVV